MATARDAGTTPLTDKETGILPMAGIETERILHTIEKETGRIHMTKKGRFKSRSLTISKENEIDPFLMRNLAEERILPLAKDVLRRTVVVKKTADVVTVCPEMRGQIVKGLIVVKGQIVVVKRNVIAI